MTGQAGFTVIVPAHDEARVIGRTLQSMRRGAGARDHFHVIVVPNGCTDDTADAARRADPAAEVIEIAQGSKSAAINEGLRRTKMFPVLVVDADIGIEYPALLGLAEALREPGVMVASPAPHVVTENSDRWTRAYYRVWSRHGYRAEGVGGSGVYGLSKEGAAMLGSLPPVIADDTYVRWSFPLSQQRRVSAFGEIPVKSVVEAPRTVTQLVACEARWHAGNVQLRKLKAGPGPTRAHLGGGVSPIDRIIYLCIKLLGRVRYAINVMTGRAGVWHRDTSTR
ncbi:glycosyltransferase [Altererythrobacter aerius]|uniref:Glycosyltransferase n=1 Tax=Tsuneonella aeria TaxID=1837929 RepID=A0A6I4T8B7_9SPHN|nr:glycosyltransferase [Tsuneonella aeria]MXO73819.1 glycosyltransferase [Tsuneonella aeria]